MLWCIMCNRLLRQVVPGDVTLVASEKDDAIEIVIMYLEQIIKTFVKQ